MKPNFRSFVKDKNSRKSRSLEDRFFEKVLKTPDCWLWIGATNDVGYGQSFFNGKIVYAHRISFEIFNGHINKGECVLHRCDNPSCVNPKHLFLGTKKQNTEDMVKKGRDKFIGERNGMAKLSWDDVNKIRIDRDCVTQKELGRKYGVSQGMVSLILSNNKWKEKSNA